MNNIYISNICPWAPGLEDNEDFWKQWTNGEKQIDSVKESPKIEYTSPLFRRRLSQITKMTVHVVHNLLEKTNVDTETKIVFTSLRGEIEREFTINKELIEDGELMPAGFSLSVFNTPISSATLAFGLKGGYSVIYPSKNNFADAFKTAVAPVLAGTEKQIIFVYADELVPELYGDKRPAENIPMAFAMLVSSDKNELTYKSLDITKVISSSPVEFLKQIMR